MSISLDPGSLGINRNKLFSYRPMSRASQPSIIGSVLCVLVLVIIIIVVIVLQFTTYTQYSKFVSNSPLGIYKKAAVGTTGPECAQIGTDILKLRNGSAVDAAIATLLCEGIASLHSTGLGGGFFMTIYDAASDTTDCLNARETAPLHAYKDMYGGNASLSLTGGLAVAVPGELLGYWAAHQRYGRLPWKDLFEPAIELAKEGCTVNRYLENSLKEVESYIRAESTLAEILVNPETNKIYSVGERIKRPKLAETLRILADDAYPPKVFYNGNMTKNMVEELNSFGGIITAEDFLTYKVMWEKPIEAKIGSMTMYTAPPPASGALLAFMMNVLENFVPVGDERVMWQRIVETFKWAYAKRTELGDPDFVNITEVVRNLTSKVYADAIRLLIKDNKTYNDAKHYGAVTTNKQEHGTVHVSVLAPDGSAVSVTSTINQVLGAKIRSKSTGIIFNDQMDDFSSPDITNADDLPPSPNNYIEPKKRPMSSMVPTIVLDVNRKVQLITGASGGTKIPTAVASTMILNLWNNYNIKEAIDAYRIHHQLFPMQVQAEHDFPQYILNYLMEIGHNVTTYSGMGSAVIAVARDNNGQVTANSDYRRQGEIDGF